MTNALLSTAQAAERLGVSRRQVELYIKDQRLPAVQVGRAWVIRESDLQAFVRPERGWKKGRKRKPEG